MMDVIKRFFEKEALSGQGSGKTSGHDTRVAACALLLEMAQIDGEFSEKEQRDMLALLKKDFGVSEADATELMEVSRKELEGSLDLWKFTHLINQNYSQEEKIGIIETVWKIVYADGVLDQHEDYLAHKLATLLRLPHKDLINAKLKVLGKV